MMRFDGNKTLLKLGNLTAAAVVIGVTLFAGVPSALATDEVAVPQQDGGNLSGRGLERAYERTKMALDHQADRLEFAGEIVGDVQEWIDELKSKGKDTTTLEAALAAYQAGLAEAQGYHDQAAAILATHAGFDDAGKLVDREQALETVRTAGRALRDGERALRDTTIDFRQTVRDWRRENREQSGQ